MHKVVSILVPVYNGEKYITKLYECLKGQTYPYYEVIFVDDFSTDKSVDIICGIEKFDSRVKLVNRKTKGGTAAKGYEYGIPYCNGDYLLCVTQDDWIDTDFLEKCIYTADQKKADIVIPNVILYYSNGKAMKHGMYPINGDYVSEIEPEEAFIASLNWNLAGNIFVKTDIVKKIGFTADYYNSCEFHFRRMYLEAKMIVFCNTNFYYYQGNENAITHQFHYFQVDVVTTDLMLLEIMRKKNMPLDKQKEQLIRIKKLWQGWIKSYLFADMNKQEKKYVKKSLVDNGKKLVRYWYKIYVKRKECE